MLEAPGSGSTRLLPHGVTKRLFAVGHFVFLNLADTEESLALADAPKGEAITRAKRVPILRPPTG